ncbi:hypothetical protein QP028_00365 [Corynebacterium suedekumii]|nr:hypothetical protein QP028_00365 [Corynebacterium suedekumii]
MSLVAVLLIGGLLAAWFLGPSLGIALRGAPFFLFPPSPERYATVVLDEAESQGLYADDPAFADARAEAERVAEQAGDVAETHETSTPPCRSRVAHTPISSRPGRSRQPRPQSPLSRP